jgi:anti-anti-sigma regulatory factor
MRHGACRPGNILFEAIRLTQHPKIGLSFARVSLYCLVVNEVGRIVGESSNGIFVGCASDNRVCVRVVGRGTFQNSQPLRQFALEKIEQGQEEFVVDLGQCRGMDSTFLGVLAGIGLRLRQNGHAATTIQIVHISSRNMELLQTLGLDRLFSMNSDTSPPLAEPEYHQLPDTDLTHLTHPLGKDETADLMIEAHDNLLRADERNASKFRELARFLREAAERHHKNEKRGQ